MRDGVTDLVVSILDRAGNTACAGKELVRAATSSQVLLFPAAATIEVGATRPLYLRDTAWQPLHGRLWMADNPAIAGVDDSPVRSLDSQQVKRRSVGGQMTIAARP